MAPRETEDNAYAKFWGEKQRTLWYVMVFLEWSIRPRTRCFMFHCSTARTIFQTLQVNNHSFFSS